jgi:hypothetical protein
LLNILWGRQKGNVTTEEQDLQTREARKALEPISRKLKGLQTTSAPVKLEKVASSESQVESLVSFERKPFTLLHQAHNPWG